MQPDDEDLGAREGIAEAVPLEAAGVLELTGGIAQGARRRLAGRIGGGALDEDVRLEELRRLREVDRAFLGIQDGRNGERQGGSERGDAERSEHRSRS
jgi:hypothetical protein